MAEITIPISHVIKHKTAIIRDGFISMMIIGKSGCGKTNFLTSIIPYISDDITTVFIATVINGVKAHKSIVDYCKKEGKFAGVVYDPDTLRGVFIACSDLGRVNENKQGLVIFDDFNIGSNRGPYWDVMIHAFTKLRNAGWNFIIISQYPTFIPPIIRNNTNSRVFFDCYSESANISIRKDIRGRIVDNNAFNLLLEYVHQVPYSYILVQDSPFTISAGSLDKARIVMDEESVKIPTLNELMKEIHVHTPEELNKKSTQLQIKAGNTSSMLSIGRPPYFR